MPPQEPEAWKGVLACNNFGPVARQVVPWYPDSIQNEKELFTVNVWTKGIKDGKKRPVMLWLHGGGFHVGASNDPMTYGEALAKKGDIVFVSVNHRLNILGFLDLSAYGDKYTQSANVGMLDIVKALEWIQKNIDQFGGNPSDVTIVGESGEAVKWAPSYVCRQQKDCSTRHYPKWHPTKHDGQREIASTGIGST